MTVKIGDIGKTIFISTGDELNLNAAPFTVLSLKFTSPDGLTTFTRENPPLASEVVLAPAVNSPNLETVGVLPANKYITYLTQEDDFDQVGEWSICVTYQDAVPSLFIADETKLTVGDGCAEFLSLADSVFYLKLDETSGPTAFDSTVNQNNFDIIEGNSVFFLTTGNSFTPRKIRFANEDGYLQLQGAQAKMGTSEVGTMWALMSNWAVGSQLHVYIPWGPPIVGSFNFIQMAVSNSNQLEFSIRNSPVGGNQGVRVGDVDLPLSSDSPILIAIIKPTASSISLYQSPDGIVSSTIFAGDPDSRWFNNVPAGSIPAEMRMLVSTDNLASNQPVDVWRIGYTNSILSESGLNDMYTEFTGLSP